MLKNKEMKKTHDVKNIPSEKEEKLQRLLIFENKKPRRKVKNKIKTQSISLF
jgi:hypothetical protein